MRTTAHHFRIASASVLQQASSALSAGNCSVARADLEATGVAADIVRRRTIALARTLPVPRHPMGRLSRRERFQICLSVLPRRQEGDHGSGWPRAALFTQNPAQLRLDGDRAALPGGCTSWTLPA
ncbi:pyridine nucleotide-bisulphide oxidoreductase family protein [Trichinella spiralis]|uniref:pyridine nucleotide-bisulphide oxidoreductase family protein n=1 Tax=Trichinella spiralis TaxID=6334 RepID=UPI0001EFCD66|nr:pyridine nucleotide-bisulphide oxidoreductase family protein [Trichinella spiralis]